MKPAVAWIAFATVLLSAFAGCASPSVSRTGYEGDQARDWRVRVSRVRKAPFTHYLHSPDDLGPRASFAPYSLPQWGFHETQWNRAPQTSYVEAPGPREMFSRPSPSPATIDPIEDELPMP